MRSSETPAVTIVNTLTTEEAAGLPAIGATVRVCSAETGHRWQPFPVRAHLRSGARPAFLADGVADIFVDAQEGETWRR